MTSQLNVDTIVDKAGSGGTNVKVGNTSTYVADGGSATQNLVQGLCKVWVEHGNDFAIDDSFNLTSLTDDGTGLIDLNIANAMGNTNYVYNGAVSGFARNTTVGWVEGSTLATSLAPASMGTIDGSGNVSLADARAGHSIHGDLA
jgi:hypothetical protein